MSNRSRKILSNTFAVLAILIGILGLYTLSVWNRVLTPELYTNAFEQSGVYTQVTNLFEAQATAYLKAEGKQIVEDLLINSDNTILEDRRILNDEIVAWLITTVIDNQTGNVVDRLSERIDLEQRVVNTTESFLQTTTSWLRGEIESPQIVELIPPSDEIADLQPIDFATSGLIYIGKLALGLDDLPACSSRTAENKALELIAQGNIREIECTNDQVDRAINSAVESLLPAEALARFREQIGTRIDLYRVENLFEGIKGVVTQLSILKEDLREFRDEVQLVRTTSILLIVMSAVFAMAAYFFSKERSIKKILWIYSIVGLSLFLIATTANYIFVITLPNFLDLSKFTIDTEVLSTANQVLLENSLTDATELIVAGINDYVLLTGSMLLMLAGIPLLLIILYERDVHIKLMNLFNEIITKIRFQLGKLFNSNPAS